MPQTVTQLRIFVASPGDVADERRRLDEVVRELSRDVAAPYGITLELKRWETHMRPGVGRDGQDVINRQIGTYDLFVGILWNRFGKPTDRAESGTREEFDQAYARWPEGPSSLEIWMYFGERATTFESQDELDQKGEVLAFKRELQGKGLLTWDYADPADFGKQVRGHLSRYIPDFARSRGQLPQQKEPQPASSAGLPQEHLRTYLDWMAKKYQHLVLRDIASVDGALAPFSPVLDDIYVPLEAEHIRSRWTTEALGKTQQDARHPRRVRQSHRGESEEALDAQEQPPSQRINLKDLLAVGPHLVVIGGPGCGKSTLLQHMAWTLAQAQATGRPELAKTRLGLAPSLPIPILLPLHSFAEYQRRCHGADDPQLTTLAACVYDYLTREEGATDLSPGIFPALLRKDGPQCLIMLDGLDEVSSEADRELARASVEGMAAAMPHNRFIVTSRPAAYTGQAVLAAAFQEVRVRPLERAEVTALLTGLYRAAACSERVGPLLDRLDELERRYAERSGAERGQRLIDSPLMVRMVATVDLSGERLPEQRAELYNTFVNALLRGSHHAQARVRQDLERLGGSPEDRREWLAVLAYAMHTLGEGTRSLEEEQVRRLLCAHLTRLGTEAAQKAVLEFVAATRGRGGVVEVRSGRRDLQRPDRWSFTHQPFQEFLAAVYLADLTGSVEAAATELERDGRIAQTWWEEVTLLLLGYLGFSRPHLAGELSARLARLPQDHAPAWPHVDDATEMAAAERVAAALAERRGSMPFVEEQIAKRLTQLVEDPTLTAPARIRAAAGRALSHLGDPRDGVGLHKATGIPEIVWCPVPSGPFLMGSTEHDSGAFPGEFPQHTEKSISEPYLIARWPITNAQFQAFVDDPEGYRNGQLWTQSGLEWRGDRSGPKKYGDAFDVPNHPAVRVTWYEAVTFCQWLMLKLSRLDKLLVWRDKQVREAPLKRGTLRVRLPTEAEWEKAARGTDGRSYPWGDEFYADKCNAAEAGVGSTSAVGVFPAGSSLYGCQDMAGNVWEWCSSKWAKDYRGYEGAAEDRENLEGDAPRVLRGGSWDYSQGLARCAVRGWVNPDLWGWGYGFRVVAVGGGMALTSGFIARPEMRRGTGKKASPPRC